MAKVAQAPKSQTTAQIVVDVTTGELIRAGTFSYKKAREMRRDPTINLCRKYSVAPIIAASWAAEGDPHQVEFLEAQFQPIRNALLRTALFCELDFGWKAFELVYGLTEFAFQDGHVETLSMIQRVKPLKNDHTLARYDKATGDFIGVSTVDQFTGEKLFIDAEHVLFVNFDDEGLGNYAEPAAQIAEAAYDNWVDANAAAARYDKKMAGTFVVCEYPVGKTKYSAKNGEETDNFEIAEAALKALLGSGQIAIPKNFRDIDPNLPAELNSWKFYFLEPQAKQGSFVDRQKYLDAQKTRAYALPERSIIEGEFGTKAEAGVHASAALLIRQQHHEDVTELINQGPVKILLRTNWGSEGTAWLKAVPLTDEKAALFRELLAKLLDDPGAGPDIKDKIDVAAVMDATGVPMLPEGPTDVPGDVDGEPLDGADPGGTAGNESVDDEEPVILNGAQVSSAVDLLNQVSAKLLPPVVALELLKGLGIPPAVCQRMSQAAENFKVPLAVVSPQAAAANKTAAPAGPKVTIS